MIQIDRSLFTPEAVPEEVAKFDAELEAMLRDLPGTHEVPVQASRDARDQGKGVFPPHGPLETGSDWVETPYGKRVRVSLPAGAPKGTYVHMHGGGWTLGRPSHQDGHNQKIARATGLAVVSVEYRLAPENPWPAGPEDCLAAAEWVIEAAPYGDGPVMLGGESAGAHLAAVTALSLRDRGEAGRVKGVVLNYGCFDLRMTPSAKNWGPRKLVLSTPIMEFFSDCFVPDAAKRADPAVSPLLADLHDLPPALFQIGTADPLIDDSLMMAARWVAAGNRAELAVYPGGIHAFEQFDHLGISKDFHARRIAFLTACLG